jgi:hypothetical protein
VAKMKKVTGSKFADTWEEKIRSSKNDEYNRFSKKQYIKNLKLLSKWCEKKIIELTEK